MSVDWVALYRSLMEPFDPADIQWRAGATNREKTKAQALPYAEPRIYEDRLNAVCAGQWSVTFTPWGEHRIICELTIAGVTRSSTGEASDDSFSPGTTAEAQAFKRACSRFGLGRFLYDLSAPWVPYDATAKRLLELPRLPTSTPQHPNSAKTLTQDRAAALHRELGKLALISSSEHDALASQVAKRPIHSFTQLTEQDARRLLPFAKRLNAERVRELETATVSDAEAAAVLG